MIEAVMFDMDGVITDTESLGIPVGMRACKTLGYDKITKDMLLATMGVTGIASEPYYRTVQPDYDRMKFREIYLDEMSAYVKEHGVPLKYYAKEILEYLKEKNIPRALVSSNRRQLIEMYLDMLHVRDYFCHIISGSPDVPSKPEPDMYLNAAKALHVDPKNCLVLEDSRSGLMAGRAAGMQVAMVPDQIPYSEALAPYCDHVLHDLSEVKNLV